MPMPALSPQTRLLVVAPHPDDETLAAGLLIQQVLAAGGAVRVLLLTDGDDNPWPQRWLERRWRIRTEDRRRWGSRRRGEAIRALARLGVRMDALEAMGWPDMGLTGLLRERAPEALASLGAAIGAFAPGLLLLPALDDRHPDHGAAHVLCRLALAGRATMPELLAYPVHAPRAASPGGDGAGGAPQQRRKLAALAEHASQTALSGGRLRRLALRPERHEPVDASMAAGDGRLPWRPPALLHPFLRLLVAEAGGVRDLAWRDAPLRRDAGGYRLELPPADGPRFAKLYLDARSPWIFDHWGWCRL
jgi:LmbE family N-acetylglucosaminyl deacetylase